MGLGKILRRGGQPDTSTNGPQKTNAANHKLGGRKVKKMSYDQKQSKRHLKLNERVSEIKSKLGHYDNRLLKLKKIDSDLWYQSNSKGNIRNDKFFNLTRKYNGDSYETDIDRARDGFEKKIIKSKQVLEKTYNKTIPRFAIDYNLNKFEREIVKFEAEIENKKVEIDKGINKNTNTAPVLHSKNPVFESDPKADETKQ